jgi:hypothetical protein
MRPCLHSTTIYFPTPHLHFTSLHLLKKCSVTSRLMNLSFTMVHCWLLAFLGGEVSPCRRGPCCRHFGDTCFFRLQCQSEWVEWGFLCVMSVLTRTIHQPPALPPLACWTEAFVHVNIHQLHFNSQAWESLNIWNVDHIANIHMGQSPKSRISLKLRIFQAPGSLHAFDVHCVSLTLK